MPTKSHNLSGKNPPKCPAALLLIDVINDLEFAEGRQMLEHALPMARQIARLKREAKRLAIPVIYVNDNFGRWQSDFKKLIGHCCRRNVLGAPVARLLKPAADDYFVLKPKHSGFFSTTLEILLRLLRVKKLILTGIAGNNCVLFTANDAYMRDFELIVPADCIVSNTPVENEFALQQMQKILKADTRPSQELDLKSLLGKRSTR